MITAKQIKEISRKSKDPKIPSLKEAEEYLIKQAKMGFTNTLFGVTAEAAKDIFMALKKGKFRVFVSEPGQYYGHIYSTFHKCKFPKLDADLTYTIDVEW